MLPKGHSSANNMKVRSHLSHIFALDAVSVC